MARKIEKLNYRFEYADKNISGTMLLDLGRFEGQYSRAQYELDNMVMTSMVPFMPHNSGVFVNVTRAMSASIAGSGKVVAAAPPMGRFLYKAKGMVDRETGSPWARPAAKKVLVSQYSGKTNAKENLTFSNSKAQPEWFEVAKKVDGPKWIRKAKKTAGGGTGGR